MSALVSKGTIDKQFIEKCYAFLNSSSLPPTLDLPSTLRRNTKKTKRLILE